MTSYPSLEFARSLSAHTPLLFAHQPHCTQKGMGHSDGAKRISDAINLHWSAGWDACVGKWVAFRLADGTGGMNLYDSKAQAVQDQSDAKRCLYVRIVPGGMTVCEGEILLKTARKLSDWGLDEQGKSFIHRVAGEHRAATLKLLGG